MSDLLKLAAARGVDASYVDHWGKSRSVSPDTLVAVLRALGEPLANERDAGHCLRHRAVTAWIPPVVVAWDGELTLPAGADLNSLELEQQVPVADQSTLPFGIHRLRVAGDPGEATVTVISAPRRTRQLGGGWALFAPVYALRDGRALLTGDFTSLQRLCELAGRLGASHVSTLPLMAGLSTADDISAVDGPYSPVSRMWWNEAYLDASRVPEMADLPPDLHVELAAKAHSAAAPDRAEVARAAGTLRPLLELGLKAIRQLGGRRLREFETFSETSPGLHLYGMFRAAVEKAGLPPEKWPATYAPRTIRAGRDVPIETVDAHIYAQWLCDEQLRAVGKTAADHGCALMLDLPIGCRADGFDPWAYPGSFAKVADGYGVSVGAPPDRFFQAGQDWGFRPLSPDGDRQAGYPVLRACLSQLMRHCSALRIDHVMGMQRLWWIPSGAPAAEGAYVHYHFEEILALTCLEAWRNDVAVAGEDLGTVDPEVRRKLQEHGIAGMHVGVFDIAARPDEPLQPRPGSMAFVDTHDTATFAGWLQASDIDVRCRLGFLDDAKAGTERLKRQSARRQLTDRLVHDGLLDPESVEQPTDAHAAVLDELGRSAAGLVSVNIEDLWAETEPQNIPGTDSQHANFSHRLAFTLAEIESSPTMTEPLGRLGRARRQAAGTTTTGT